MSEDFEDRLRNRLSSLAADVDAVRFSPKAPTRGGFLTPTLVTGGLLAIGAVVVGILALAGPRGGGGLEAETDSTAGSCPNAIRYGEVDYFAHGNLVRLPFSSANPIGEARRLSCDSSTEAGDLPVYSIVDVAPDVAIVGDGQVWINSELSEIPENLRAATQPVQCDFAAPEEVTVDAVVEARSERPSRFDGDLQIPYVLTMTTDSPVATRRQWEKVTIIARGRDAGASLGRVGVEALTRGTTITLACRGSRFDIVGIN